MNRTVRPSAAAVLFLLAGSLIGLLLLGPTEAIIVGPFCGLAGATIAHIPRAARDDPSRLRFAIFLFAVTAYTTGAILGLLLWFGVVAALLPLTLLMTVAIAMAATLAIADDLRTGA